MDITLYHIGDYYEAVTDDREVAEEVATATGRRVMAVGEWNPYRKLGHVTVGIPCFSLDDTISILRTRGNVVKIEEVA